MSVCPEHVEGLRVPALRGNQALRPIVSWREFRGYCNCHRNSNDIGGSTALRAMIYAISEPTDDAHLGGKGQEFEKVVRVEGSDANGYVVTAIRGGGVQGSYILDLDNNNVAGFLHVHYAGNGLVPQPNGGDNSSIKFKNIPSFVYGADISVLREVIRAGGQYKYGTIDQFGGISNIKPFLEIGRASCRERVYSSV